MKRKAIVIGATGLVGKHLVSQLSLMYDSLIIIARKQPTVMSSTMQFYQLKDFNNLNEVMANINIGADTDAFSCLGTTKRKAGSQEAFRHVDFEYNVNFAKNCHAKGIENFFLLSALGVDINSRFFYSRVKAEIEAAIGAIGFRKLIIFRPSLLLGYHKGRPLEALAQSAFKVLAPAIPKSLGMRPISAERVAAAMAMTAQNLYERSKYMGNNDSQVEVEVIDNKHLLAMTCLKS